MQTNTPLVMSWKSKLKSVIPRPIHYLYNRLFSKRIIQGKLGSWFDLEWKRKALSANDEIWIETYDEAWKNCREQDLSPADIRRIADKVIPGASALDAGCGDGYLIEALLSETSSLTGVDISRVALGLARRRLGADVPLIQAFLEKLPFRENAFDIVVSAHTLEHVKDIGKAVSEIKRVASRRIIILLPSQEYIPYSMDYHLHFFPREDDLLELVGLDQAVCERYTLPPGMCAYQGDVFILTADL
ncbi:MAG: class I SAM-dependent methyltransferase [candidate division Zixibacteria bacterium]|nr:class I SAM-dependent methyltransferase [Candidatus Tariuqbacter arcticus]